MMCDGKKLGERKQKAGCVGQNGEEQEDRGHAGHPVGAEQSEHDDDAGDDTD